MFRFTNKKKVFSKDKNELEINNMYFLYLFLFYKSSVK